MYATSTASQPPSRRVAQPPILLGAGARAATASGSDFRGAVGRTQKDFAGSRQLRVPPRSGADGTALTSRVPCGVAGAAPGHGPPGQLVQRRPLTVAPRDPAPAVGMCGGMVRSRLQADEDGEVVAFLREAGLQMYTAHLIENGFDDMETLIQIEDSDMKDLWMPPHDILRLRRKLQELQGHGAGQSCEPDASHLVVAFLEDNGLGQYAHTLLQNGFDEMETLLDMDDLDMKDVGIPRGHALKLKKRLHEYQLQQSEQDQPEFLQSTNQRTLQELQSPPLASRSAPPVPSAPVTCRASAAGRAPGAAVASHALPTEQARTAVVQSWEQVQILGTFTVGELLYRHTFALAPQVVELFPLEVRAKYRVWSEGEEITDDDESSTWESKALRNLFAKVVNAVGCTVAGLHDFSKLVPMLTKLGARHVGYGVAEAYWQVLGKALDLTLSELLREAYTQEVQSAWTMVYGFMSSIMIEGLRAARQEQAAACAPTHHTAKGSASGSTECGTDDAMSQVSSTIGHRSVSEALGEEIEQTPSSMRSR